MRKGRSSRRSRISRPLVSVKGEALSTDAGPASSGSLSPRVVLGISPSDPPESLDTPLLAVEAKGPSTLASTMIEGYLEPERDVVPPPPPVDEAPVSEAKAEPIAEAAEEPLVALPDPVPTPSFAKTLAFGSKLDELPQSAPIPAAPVVSRDREIRERKEARERLRDTRVAAQAAAAKVAPSADPDEISVPPASDLGNDDGVVHEKFFSEGDLSKHLAAPDAATDLEDQFTVSDKARRKADPLVIRRREKLARYVKIAVAGAAVVCLAAIGSSAVNSAKTSPTSVAAALQPEPPTPPPVTAKEADPAAALVTPEPAAEALGAPAASAEVLAETVADAKPAEEPITGDAKEELKKSRKALEKGKPAEAIEAGEKSVAIDPSDGEAWLILGAAYQEKGNLVEAHRCYAACLKQGKTGPRIECQKMLR